MRSKDESPPIGGGGAQNTLYYGDNLEILRKHVKDESIDLIYLDPPFNSNVKYNVIYKTEGREESPAQIQAFDDTWTWTSESEIVYDQLMGTRIGGIISGLKEVIGTNDLMAYLVMMSIRILDLHRVLKLTGSLYLHCDPTASHYLKIVLDAVFGPQNFRNEIVWHYRKWSAGWQQFQRNHDVLLFYSKSKSKDRVFNKMYMERAESTKKRFGNKKIVSGYDKNGRRLPAQMEETVSPGVPMDDVWEIRRVAPVNNYSPHKNLSRYWRG